MIVVLFASLAFGFGLGVLFTLLKRKEPAPKPEPIAGVPELLVVVEDGVRCHVTVGGVHRARALRRELALQGKTTELFTYAAIREVA